jgi:hypothetical protein
MSRPVAVPVFIPVLVTFVPPTERARAARRQAGLPAGPQLQQTFSTYIEVAVGTKDPLKLVQALARSYLNARLAQGLAQDSLPAASAADYTIEISHIVALPRPPAR